MTKREMFGKIRELVISNKEMVKFIDHEIELLDKKNSGIRKPTKVQLENKEFKEKIVDYLVKVDAPKNISTIQSEIPELTSLTNQRITHLLTDLVNAEKLSKEYIKKVPYYTINK